MDKFALTAQLLMQAPANLMQTVRTVKDAFKDIDVNVKVKTDVRALQGIENDLKRLRDAGKQTSQFYNEIGGILANATRRFAGISIATGTFLGLARAIKNGIGDAIVFEREMAKIAQATETSLHATKSLGKEIGNIAVQYGVASDELVKFARNFAQAGFNIKQTTAALELLAKTEAIGTFGTMENTMEGIITTLSVFSKEAKGSAAEIDFLNKSFDAINKISKKYAIESEDIITAIRRTGSTFKEAGGSIEELMAVMTSVRATTRESADTIANGLKTIVTRLQRGDTADILKEIGAELVDLDGKFVGPAQAFQKLNLALSQYQDGSNIKAGILEKIGGTYQIGRLIPAIKNAALQQQVLNDAKSAGGDIDKDYAITQDTLANKITKTKEAFAALVRDLSLNTEFKAGISVALAYANAFIRIADALKGLLPLLAIWASISAAKASFGFIQAFSGGKVSTPKINASKVLAGSPVGGYATGGFVSGAPGIDKNPAMLTDGEFVVNRKDAQRNKRILSAINSGKKVEFRAEGGESGKKKRKTSRFQARSRPKGLKDKEPEPRDTVRGYSILDQQRRFQAKIEANSENGDRLGPVQPRYKWRGVYGFEAPLNGGNNSIDRVMSASDINSTNNLNNSSYETNNKAKRVSRSHQMNLESAYDSVGLTKDRKSPRELALNSAYASVGLSPKKPDAPDSADMFKKQKAAFDRNLEAVKKEADVELGLVSELEQYKRAIRKTRLEFEGRLGKTFKADLSEIIRGQTGPQRAQEKNRNKESAAANILAEVRASISGPNSPNSPPNSPSSKGVRGSGKGSSVGAISDEKEVAERADRTGLYLLALVGGVTALTESMTSLDDSTKRSIQSSVAFGTIFYSIAKSSIPFFAEVVDRGRATLSNFQNTVRGSTKSVASGLKAVEVSSKAAAASEDVETASNLRAAKSNSGVLSGAISGFTIGISIAVGMLEYFASKLREAASVLDEDAKKEITKFSETGMGSSDITKEKMIAAQKIRNKASTGSSYGWGGAAAGGAYGAAMGAGIGSMFAGVGAAPGALIGGGIGSIGGALVGNSVGTSDGNKVSKDEEDRIKKSVDVQYESIKAVNNFTKALDLSKKSYSNVDKSFEILKNASGEMSKDLEKANNSFNDLSKNMFKTRNGLFGEYKPKKENLSKEELDIYGNAEDRKKEATNRAREASGEVYNSAINKTVANAKLTNDPEEINKLFNSKDITDGINEASKLFAQTINIQSNEGYKAFLEYRKALLDDASNIKKETLKQNDSNNNSITARESEIRLIMQLNSQFDQLTQTTLNLDRSQRGLDLAMGKGSSGIDPRRFSDVSRVGDMKDFESDVRAVFNGLGSDEQRISKEIINMAKVADQFRKNILADDLNKLGNKVRQDPKESETEISNYLSGVSADFINSNSTMKKASIAYAKELLNGGHITAEKLKDFIDKFISGGKPLLDIAQALSETQKRNIEQIKATTSALVDIESAIEGLKSGLVDISETGRQRISDANKDRATNGDLDQDIANRQVARGNSMRARLGNLGGGISSPQDLGNVLSKLQQKYLSNRMTLEKSGVDSETTARLESENIKLEKSIKSVTNELTRLTDQSARAADVMSQLDREQGKKDFVKGKMSDYVLGGAEERMSMQEQFQALQHVMMSGSFQGLPEDLRKAVNGLGDEISRSDPNSKFVKGINNAKANDANRLFGRLPPELDKIARGGTSNKEDRLIDELTKINNEEIAAQKLLITAEEANTKAIIDLTGALNNKNAQVPVGGQAVPGGQVPFGNPILPQAKMGGMGAAQDDERTPRQKLGDRLRAKKKEIGDRLFEVRTRKKLEKEGLDEEEAATRAKQEAEFRYSGDPNTKEGKSAYSFEAWEMSFGKKIKRDKEKKLRIDEFEQSKKTQRDEELKYQEEEQVRKEIRDANEARKLEAKKPENQPHNIVIAKRRKEYEDAMAAIPTTPSGPRVPTQVGLEKASGIPHEYPDIMKSRTGSRDDYGPNGTIKPSKPTDFSGLGPNQGSFADQANNKLNSAMNWWNNPMTQYHGPIKGSRDGVEWGSPINSNLYGTKKPEIGSVQDSSRGFFPQLGEVINKDLGSGIFVKSKAQEEQDKKDKRMAEYERSHWGESLSRGYARGGVIGTDNMVGVQSGEGIIHKTAMSKIGKNGLQAINSGLSGGGTGLNISSLNTFTNNLKSTLESAINKIPEAMNTFSASMGTITTSLNGIAQSLSNITMKHEVNIGGQLSVAGFNTEKVAEALKDSLGEFISIAVKDSIDKQNKAFRTA